MQDVLVHLSLAIQAGALEDTVEELNNQKIADAFAKLMEIIEHEVKELKDGLEIVEDVE
jgi:cold shock CspA family protein